MSFSYGGDPSGSVLDSIRFLVGDTESDEPLLEDAEITWLIGQWNDRFTVYYTASMAANAIAARFAREISVTSDSQTLGTSELQDKYIALAAQLMAAHQQLLAGGSVDVGGINVGEQPDPTVRPPSFGTGMHDSAEAGQQDLGDIQDRPEYGWYVAP